jgi:hypothetical protein
VKHPSDDLMTERVNAEFAGETGTTRKFSRDEVLIFVSIIACAGSAAITGQRVCRAQCSRLA